MKEGCLLEDVNLSEICFGRNGTSVTLAFLNMSDGSEVGTLVCSGLAFFAFSHDPDGSLPVYVGEVYRVPVRGAGEVRELLKRLGYGFRDWSGSLSEVEATAYHVHAEGGITLDIVCQKTTWQR
jgi:hypothetical protein